MSHRRKNSKKSSEGDLSQILRLLHEQNIRFLIAGAPAVAFSFDEAWPRRVTVKENDYEIHFVSKSDLIRMKEAVGRPKDLLDIDTP